MVEFAPADERPWWETEPMEGPSRLDFTQIEEQVAEIKRDLAPDFVRHVPRSAIATADRQEAADDWLSQARTGLADRWQQLTARGLQNHLLDSLPFGLGAPQAPTGPGDEDTLAAWKPGLTDPLTYLRNFVANLPPTGGTAALTGAFAEAMATGQRLAAAHRQALRPETEPGTPADVLLNVEEFAYGAALDPSNFIPGFSIGRRAAQARRALPVGKPEEEAILAKLGGGLEAAEPFTARAIEFVKDIPRWLRKSVLSADARLSDAQKVAEGAFGGQLPPELRAKEALRKESGAYNRSLLTIRGELRDAYSLAHDDIGSLEKYLEAWDNIDKAASITRRIAAEPIADIRPSPLRRTIEDVRGQLASTIEELRIGEVSPKRAGQLGRLADRLEGRIERLTARAADQESARLQTRVSTQAAKAIEAGETRKFSGDITAGESQEALAILESKLGEEGFANVQRAGEGVWRVVDALRGRLVGAGVFPPEMAAALARDFPHYIPINILDYMADPSVVAAGKKITLSDSGLRRLTEKGTTRTRENVTDSLVRLVFETEKRAAKNETARAVYNWRNLSDELGEVMRDVPEDYRATRDETIAHFFDAGELHRVAVSKPFAEAIELEPGPRLPGPIEWLFGKPAELIRTTAVTHNPLFAIAGNPLLDVPSYLFHSSALYGPQRLPVFVAELARSLPDVFSGLTKNAYTGEGLKRLWSKGGGQLGYFGGSPGETAKFAAEIRRGGGLVVNNPADLIKGLAWDLTPAVGTRVENAPRVAGMRLAERYGVDELTTIMRGRQSTMDFDEGGTWTKALNAIIPFFNISSRPVPWLINLAKENPRAFTASVVAGPIGATAVAEAWNRSSPDRAQAYDDVPNYIKKQGLIIMSPQPIGAPDARGRPRLNYLLIPTRNFTTLVSPVREAMLTMMGKSSVDDWKQTLAGLIGTTTPVQTDSWGAVAGTFVPGVIGTAFQLAVNRDLFRERAIVSEEADDQATAGAKALAQISGQRPSAVEYLIRDIGTGVGGIVLAAVDLAAKIKAGEPLTEPNPTLRDLPLVGGMLRRFMPSVGGQRDADLRSLHDSVRWALVEERKRQIGERWGKLPEPSKTAIEAEAGKAATGLVYGTEVHPATTLRNLRDALKAAGRSPEQISQQMVELRARFRERSERVEPIRRKRLPGVE